MQSTLLNVTLSKEVTRVKALPKDKPNEHQLCCVEAMEYKIVFLLTMDTYNLKATK
jgi:hypothetical protein